VIDLPGGLEIIATWLLAGWAYWRILTAIIEWGNHE
jgi:hypothetical protein